MNLMTQVIENIYEHGNAVLHLKEKPKWEINFYVGENSKLKVQIKQDFGNDLIMTYDLDEKERLIHICLLAYYSFCNQARKKDLVYLTSNNEKYDSKMAMPAINELYQQLIPLLSVKEENIRILAMTENDYRTWQAFTYLAKDIDSPYKELSIFDIMKSLVEKSEIFEETLQKGYSLWKKVGEGSIKESNEAAYKWDNFLNKLYINQFYNNDSISLSSIDIDYEFLTSKNYVGDPAVDSEEQIENLEIALLTPNKSALLVGPPGVGKTAITEALAYRIITGQVPPALKNKKILKINTSSIVRGCKYVGMFEEKVEKIMRYLIENPDTILFIDEIHTAIGAGVGGKSNLDLANIMKPYLDRGLIKVIGATTEEEYEEYIKNDKAFNRRYQKVTISEPQKNSVYKILKTTIAKLEITTNVKWNFASNISDMIIKHIVVCTDEKYRDYNDKRYNPDISITILENIFAIALLRGYENISIDNITDALRRCEYLYKSVRNKLADELLHKYKSINPSDTDSYPPRNNIIRVNFNR